MANSRPDTKDMSVLGLLTRLSELTVKEDCPSLTGKKLNCLVNKARSSLFGTILGKYNVAEISTLSEKLNHMSPLSWLIAQRFVLSNSGREIESSELDDIIRELFVMGWDDAPHPILQTLICLTNSVGSETNQSASYEPFCLSRRLGLLGSQKESDNGVVTSYTYPAISPDTFKPPPWMSINRSVSQLGGYKTSFPFNKKPGEDLPLLRMYCGGATERNTDRSVYQLRSIPALTGPRDLTFPSNWTQSNYEDEGYFTPVTEVPVRSQLSSERDDPTKIWTEALKTPLPQQRSWETFGNLVTEAEPPFISSSGPEALHNLSILVNTFHNIFNTQNDFDLKPTSREEFVRDVFLLLTGIGSSNFPYVDENNCFVARRGMWLEGYCADDTAKLCHDFLFCGTHFKRLESLSCSLNSLRDGLMACSLMDCIRRWTQFYHGAILILSSHFKTQGPLVVLYELLENVQPLKQQVDCLSRLCCVDGSTENVSLPSGVALLAHIYREASKSNCQTHLLYSALKSCCEVYLRCLQRWIFFGDCSYEERNEFFVWRDPEFSTKRDRTFWVRGFILNKSAVPVFLQGLEVAVFDCGRAMNLLQLCNPHHPLCMLLDKRHPIIRCCLYKSDMEKVEEECTLFEEEAQKACGKFTDVAMLLEEEREQEIRVHKLVQEAHKEREIFRASAKFKFEKERAEIREKRNAALQAQILEIQERKAAEKEQQRIEDELYLLECKRLDEAAKIMEEEQRKKIVAHYEALGKIVDKQNHHREWQIKRLKLADKRHAFLYEDSLNTAKDTNLSVTIPPELPSSETTEDGLPDLSVQDDLPKPESRAKPIEDEETLPPTDFNLSLKIEEQAKDPSCAKDLFKKSAAIKAKVLQIEYGISQRVEEAKADGSLEMGGKSLELTNSVSSEQSILNVDSNASDVCASSCKAKTDDINLKTKSSDIEVSVDRHRNRQRVMTEHDNWKSSEGNLSCKKSSKDSGIDSDLERNRRRVLEGQFNKWITTTEPNTEGFENRFIRRENVRESDSVLSDLQRNRRRVLGEEYNIFTGEKPAKKSDAVSAVMTKTDSGIVASAISYSDSNASQSVGENHSNPSLEICEENMVSSSIESKRPTLLSVHSETSSLLSPLTPHAHTDMPVFTSPFKGTDCLPNGLPLASPLVNFASEKMTRFEVNGIPLMVDIVDNFCLNYSPQTMISVDDVDHKDDGEVSKTLPNTSWLESSLQTCLLLPLRVQYKYVSAALLHFYLVDLNFLAHLKSLRSYFLMQDGEFGRHVTMKLFSQMYQVSSPDKLFNSPTLDKIVKEALARSQGITDPNHCRVALDVSYVPDHFSPSSLNVFDCLRLSYKVKWPLNLLLTLDVLEKYNLIFVFLVRLKRVAWLLQDDFVALKNTARGCFKEQNRDLLNSLQYHQVQMIRHTMSQFVQATLNYVSSSVLHASWTDFASSLKQTTTIDHIYNAHIEYIKRLLKRCLLNNNSKRVEAVLSKILSCIIKFHSHLRVRPWQVPSKLHGVSISSMHLEHPNFQQLQRCCVYFKMQVSKLLNYLERLISPPNQQQHLAEYLQLLNINGFYKSSDYLKHVENVNNSDGKSLVSSQSTRKEQLPASR